VKAFLQSIFQNIPNTVSILGVLPLALLFTENGFIYIIPLIVFNNIMDDLDGILARELKLQSEFGARMDNLADSVAHTLFIFAIGSQFGLWTLLFGLLPVSAFMIRSVSRLGNAKGGGSPTNELIRHLLFVLVLSEIITFNISLVIILLYLAHTITMLWELPMPHLIRSWAKSSFLIALVNTSLIMVWIAPDTVYYVGGAFLITYVISASSALFRDRKVKVA
jgi:phosphatidylglycerophosphate synthase